MSGVPWPHEPDCSLLWSEQCDCGAQREIDALSDDLPEAVSSA